MFSISCKKELPHYYVSDAFKSWTVFNKGSYWIFQNDSTLIFDSVFVTVNPSFLEFKPNSSNANFTLERIEMSYSSVFFHSSMITIDEGGQYEAFFIQINNDLFHILLASSADNFIQYHENTIDGSIYQLLSSDSVFYLGPEKFYKVVSTQYTINKKKWTCWFARDIGLIKVTGENTSPDFSWSLLRYHIAK